MEFVVYKTSSDELNNIRNFSTIEDFLRFKTRQKNDLIITDNPVYKTNPNDIAKYNRVDIELAKRLSEIEYAIEIYNDYRE